MRRDSIFSVNLPLYLRWNVAHFFGVPRDTEILGRNIKCVAGSQLRIGNDWRGLLGEGDLGEKQQQSERSSVHGRMYDRQTWIRRKFFAPKRFELAWRTQKQLQVVETSIGRTNGHPLQFSSYGSYGTWPSPNEGRNEARIETIVASDVFRLTSACNLFK